MVEGSFQPPGIKNAIIAKHKFQISLVAFQWISSANSKLAFFISAWACDKKLTGNDQWWIYSDKMKSCNGEKR